MSNLESKMRVRSFFVMDENFLLYRRRALELMDLMEKNGKAWSLFVFASARSLGSYSDEQLVRLGISWVWVGLEGENAPFAKLKAVETHGLVHRLQSLGIRVMGSSIIGLETHTPDNIETVIEHAVRHGSDFHQFMLYTPIPGTQLWSEMKKSGELLEGVDESDTHGQYQLNFRHPHISPEQSSEFLLRAFRRDYEVNGPSILRVARTLFNSWERSKICADPRVRERLRRDARALGTAYAGALWAIQRYFRRRNEQVAEKSKELLARIRREFGMRAWFAGSIAGMLFRISLWLEERRLAVGKTYEPPTFVDRRNWGPHGS
jgi:radical SAM superfamily enzyme YgiQ (UPF0313 family)